MGKLFGTDGVRGIINKDLTAELAFQLGQASAFIFSQNNKKPIFIIGTDTRYSCNMLESAISAGINSVGGEVISVGVVPTPAIAFLIRDLNADAGIVISASHNPYEYNGIKFFDQNGFKLPDEMEDKIEDIVFYKKTKIELPDGRNVGKIVRNNTCKNNYIKYLKSTVSNDLSGLKIALDFSNGAAYEIGEKLFVELGAEIIATGNIPNGININKNCGSTNINNISELVIKLEADFGLAFDGDADRCLAVDASGNYIDGDMLMYIFAKDLKNKDLLKKNTVVATVMSNLGLEFALENINCNLIKSKVGDRYVLKTMLEKNYNFGGEQSGHIIFLDYNTTGDGLLTGLQLASIIKNSKKSLKELVQDITILPQVLVNVNVDNAKKHSYIEDIEIVEKIYELEKYLEKSGRVLIRPSGTEALIRIMLEGENENEITQLANDLAEVINRRLN
jgi:phosphoglucosamine mutase